jgi:hypothetical protein
MLWINATSDKPCFICQETKGCVEVSFKDKTFKGVLCLSHVHQKLKGKEVKDAPSVRTGAA